jgi:hypothetical protein
VNARCSGRVASRIAGGMRSNIAAERAALNRGSRSAAATSS